MIRRYMLLLKASIGLSDYVIAVVVFRVLVDLRFEIMGGDWSIVEFRPLQLAIVYGLLWVASMWLMRLYRLRTHWAVRGEVLDILRATLVMLATCLGLIYLFDLSEISRVLVAMLVVAQPLATIGWRLALRRGLEALRSHGRISRQLLVIGAGVDAQRFADSVVRQSELGLRVIGHLRSPDNQTPAVSRPVIGTIDDIERVLHSSVVDEVAICLEPRDWAYVEPVTRICQEEGKLVRVSIEPLGGVLTGGYFEEVGGLPIVTFLYGPDRLMGMLAKRAFDIVVSTLLLAMLSPVMLLIALYIRVADGSPILFRQSRIGLQGRTFTCLKFRTMVPDAESRYAELADSNDMRGPAFKMANDPRIAPRLLWLRRTSLDELPQLWNVLRGEMSIVGPRPAPPREVDLYSVWHRRRLTMRPGLTGLWQVSARSDEDFDRRVALDLDYIDRWSLWMDVKILMRTIPVVIGQEGH